MTLDSVTPTTANGIGPHTLTIGGTAISTAPNACQIVMKDGSGQTRGQSALGTATATAFTAPVTFEPFAPPGPYTCWLAVSGVGSAGPTFTLTRTAPQPVAVTPPGGHWYRGPFPAGRR